MKLLKIQAILFISIFIIIGKVIGQTNNWNENYAETIFSDNFSGSALDGNKWNVSVFKRDIGILIDSTATVKVNNGKLELTMINCPNCETTDWNGTTYNGNYAGGEIVSNVTPFQYGIFECYAKYAQLGGSWPAFWIIGSDGTPCPPGSYGNEIDISEYFCKGVSNNLQHNIHHYHPSTNCTESVHHLVSSKNYSYNGNNSYHIFKCVWTPNKISYYVDGVLKHEVVNTNQICAETNQKWFPEFAMRLVLSQQITQPYNVLGQEINPTYPQTSFFDWVKVKKFFLAPEITCTPVICSSGTAAMYVDPSADSITWSLTPTNLFSGTKTGTGKNATITAASGASGQGKITYTFKMPSGEIFTAEKTFWVGVPAPAYIDFVNIGPNYPNSMVLCNDMPNDGKATWNGAGDILEYAWSVKDDGGNTWQVNQHPMVDYPDIPMEDVQFSKPYGSVNGWVNVKVKARNTCGWGDYKLPALQFSTSSCYSYYLNITPNPSSGETVLTIENQSEEKFIEELAEWELEVYDSFQSLKLKNTKLKGQEHKIQTAGWKEGVYIVRVKYNDEILTGKLVVKK